MESHGRIPFYNVVLANKSPRSTTHNYMDNSCLLIIISSQNPIVREGSGLLQNVTNLIDSNIMK